jgi:hypothetical protein
MDGDQNTSISVERCAKRYGFVASAELIDLQSETKLQERTTDLSLYGCCISVDTKQPFVAGTRVRVAISYNGARFAAIGRVAYSTSDGDMGIAFMRTDRDDQIILEKWIAELQKQRSFRY